MAFPPVVGRSSGRGSADRLRSPDGGHGPARSGSEVTRPNCRLSQRVGIGPMGAAA